MNKPTLILSTCGTSSLTNGADEVTRKLLMQNANFNEAALSSEVKQQLDAQIASGRERLLAASTAEARRYCAELNGLMALYDQQRAQQDAAPRVEHVLLVTDTYLGRATGELVRDWLEAQDFGQAQVHVVTDLQTRDFEAFRVAASELAQWCGSTLPEYARAGYQVVMNLTGGFKSVNGLLQSLGMLYADEVVYLFEGAGDLLRIPRLPVKVDVSGVMREHLATFRLLGEAKQSLPLEQVAGIPETLLTVIGGEAVLSVWGEALWQEVRDAVYTERLLPSPLPERLVFGPKLEKSVAGQPGDRLRTINKTIDQLARHMLSHGEYNPDSLDYKALKGKGYNESTHECDLWANGGGYRLFIHEEQRAGVGLVRVIDTMHTGLH